MYNALFTTAYDLNLIAPSSRAVLGLTSLFMLEPVYWGRPAELQLSLTGCCAASTLCWLWPAKLLHVLDKWCAWVFLALLVRHTKSAALLCCVLPLLGLCFGVACVAYPDLDAPYLVAHLAFRYVFFWWAHIVMVGTPSAAYFAQLSAAYVGISAALRATFN